MAPAWTGKLLSLELAAPLHLGERVSGNLRQTRRYIPGRAIWGALTQRLTRIAGKRLASDFQEAGDRVHESVRFSYAFPSTDRASVKDWPWDDPERFDWLYLQSYTSTALQDGRTKEDGSLHETECLAPRTREGKSVYLLLYLWKSASYSPPEGASADLFEPAFWQGVSIGGERGYGWGRIGPVTVADAPGDLFGLWSADDELKLTPKSNSNARALSHVISGAARWSGEVEPLVGRETRAHRPGLLLSPAEITYKPGSLLTTKASFEKVPFEIGRFGLWKEAQAPTE